MGGGEIFFLKPCPPKGKSEMAPVDGLPAKIYKYGGNQFLANLHQIIVCVWTSKEVPQQWKDATIITIHKKKSDKSECGKSRGISLLSVAGKILAKILLKRLTNHIAEEFMPETQCGFRQNRSNVGHDICCAVDYGEVLRTA